MRLANRVFTAVLTLLLFCATVLTIIEVIYTAFGRQSFLVPHDRWYQDLRKASWNDPSVRWTCIFLVVAGFVVLWMQVKRRPPVALRLASEGNVRANVMREELGHSLERRVQEIEGVESALVKLSPKKVTIRVRTPQADRPALARAVSESVSSRLESLHLDRSPRVRVKVRHGSEE